MQPVSLEAKGQPEQPASLDQEEPRLLVSERIFPSSESLLYLYLYSAQHLHVLQDSKHSMTHPTVQVQPNSQVTDIPLTERQRLKDDHLSTSLRFFNLPLGIGPNDRGPPF